MSIELSLFKIADALQMPLTYHDGVIEGEVLGVLKTSVGLELPIQVKAKKLFWNDQCGVLVDVVGDLSMIIAHFPKMSSVSAYLIDKDKLFVDGVKTPPELFIAKKMKLAEVIKSVRKAVVASFYYKEGKWKPLTLPA